MTVHNFRLGVCFERFPDLREMHRRCRWRWQSPKVMCNKLIIRQEDEPVALFSSSDMHGINSTLLRCAFVLCQYHWEINMHCDFLYSLFSTSQQPPHPRTLLSSAINKQYVRTNNPKTCYAAYVTVKLAEIFQYSFIWFSQNEVSLVLFLPSSTNWLLSLCVVIQKTHLYMEMYTL